MSTGPAEAMQIPCCIPPLTPQPPEENMFDAREVTEVFEPPTFISEKGRVYVGRHLSVPEWLPLERQIQLLGQMDPKTVDYEVIRSAVERITKKMFPKPFWAFWYRSATWHVLHLPPIPMMRALWDFLKCQALALGRELSPVSPGTRRLLGIEDED